MSVAGNRWNGDKKKKKNKKKIDKGSCKGMKSKEPRGPKESKASSAAKRSSEGDDTNRKRRLSTSSAIAEKASEKSEILSSFLDAYHPLIQALPSCLWPASAKHGQHSYTVRLGLQKKNIYIVIQSIRKEQHGCTTVIFVEVWVRCLHIPGRLAMLVWRFS